jgi:DNA primase
LRFPPQLLDEIRARLPVSQVVQRRVRMKKAGREWKGLSPFNAEKTPSFYVNDQKGFYHCFSSGKHGDIFTFLMETEGLSFPEAVERLAADAGVPLPKPSREDRQAEEQRRSLYDVVEMAAAYFEGALEGRFGTRARDYLARRGLDRATQAAFRIGYASPERFGLRDHLAEKGVTREAMIEAGLIVAGDDIPVPYDRFRDRVMFPITDLRGRVIAFGGRALSAEAPAKYLNSPETPLFEKGRLLYNLHRARGPAHDRGTVIAVEGYIDVIALSAAGFPHVVAPLGTALTEEQLALLWRLAEEPVLCFDGDKAGRRAADRAVDLALSLLAAGKSLRFALLPEGQDPDDLVRAGGPAAMERVIAAARPLVDMLWARETESGPLDTPERRAGLERRLRQALATMRDETLKRHYRDEIESRLGLAGPTAGTRRGMPAWRSRQPAPASLRVPLRVSPHLARSALFSGGESPREAFIVASLVAHPDLLEEFAEGLAEIELASADARAVTTMLLAAAGEGDGLSPELLAPRLARGGLGEAAARLEARVRPGDRWALHPHADPLRLGDALRQAITLHRRARTLNSELRAAERALAGEESEANLAWLRDVHSQLSTLEGAEADLDDGSRASPLAPGP